MNEKKLDYSLKLERFWEKNNDLLEKNHALEIPVLQDLNGEYISDSDVIFEYLEEMYTQNNLLGTEYKERAEARRLNIWFSNQFSKEITIPLLYEKIFKQYTNDNSSPKSKLIREAKNNINKHFKYIDWLILKRNWLASDKFSIADISAASQISVLDFLSDISWNQYPETKLWYMRIKSRPSFKTFLSDSVPGISPPKHYDNLDW